MLRTPRIAVVASVVMAALLSLAQGQDVNVKFDVSPEKPPAEWKTLTVREEGKVVTYYQVPDTLLRRLGIRVRDIPDDQNAALVYWQAFDALKAIPWPAADPAMDAAYNTACQRTWSIDDGPGFATLYGWLQSTAEARALLRKAAAMKECRFPVLFHEPNDDFLLVEALLPHLAYMRNAARMLVIEAHLLEKQGKFREALDADLVLMSFGHHAGSDTNLIGGLVDITVTQMAENSIKACLESNALDADTLRWLAQKLEDAASILPDRAAWISAEKASDLQIISRTLGLWPWVSGETFPRSRMLHIVLPDRILAQDTLKYYDWYAGLLKVPPWQAARWILGGGPGVEQAGCKDWDYSARLLFPAVTPALLRFERCYAWHDLLRINVALRRYRLAHGHYPETLDKLSPEFLKTLPPDPFSGEPYHYRLDNGEWILYSVGQDLKDDGGLEIPQNSGAPDIVFHSKKEAAQ